MSILTGAEIAYQHMHGRLDITPFHRDNLGPNSYNLTLADELLTYRETLLDCKKDNPTYKSIISEGGYTLRPGVLYLGRTVEMTSTPHHVPMIEGRSSFARLGMTVHVTGGFGDIGFMGKWTLEISVVEPLIIYPNMQVCQIFYHEPVGPTDIKYNGKYQGDVDVGPSRLHQELNDSQCS